MKAMNNWIGRTAYQIIPDRFFYQGESLQYIANRKLKECKDRMPDWQPDSDGVYRNRYFYGGNLKGIEAKLEYLKELGFNMLYLTPIGQSDSYHHYDVGNHFVIDPWIGTWEDFKALCTKAKMLGILLIVDLVFNHVGINSIYYSNSRYESWFKKTESGEQVFWWGFQDLPECNTLSKDYQEAMANVVEKYLENGASGVRLDLGESLPKEFLDRLAKVKEKYPTAIFIGEMWGIATDKEDPKIFDGQLDSVMNYPMADAILRWTRYGLAEHFKYNFNRVYKEYPKEVQNVLLNNIGTHDTPTTMTMLVGDSMNPDVFDNRIWDIEKYFRNTGSFDTYKFRKYESEHDTFNSEAYEHGKTMLKIALAIMYNIPGIPTVYQGTDVADTGYKDPFNRKPYPWDKQESEIKDFLRNLGKYRLRNLDILSQGDSEILKITDSILIFERKAVDKKLVICVNRSNDVQELNIKEYMENPEIVFENNNDTMGQLKPYGIIIAREN